MSQSTVPSDPTRRNLLVGSAAVIAGSLAAIGSSEAAAAITPSKGAPTMSHNTITTNDGTQIFYKDWGTRRRPGWTAS